MYYKLLGMAVWHGGKLFLRQKYGAGSLPKPLLVGAVAVAIGGVVLAAAAKRNGSD